MALDAGKGRLSRDALLQLAAERLRDFEVLLAAGRYAAAIYLAGYAVECMLKAQICRTLDLDDLPEAYEKHHLLVLLLHSGQYRRVQTVADGAVFESLTKLDGLWNPADRERNIRYIHDPNRYGALTAEDVRRWMLDEQAGVITWLRSQS